MYTLITHGYFTFLCMVLLTSPKIIYYIMRYIVRIVTSYRVAFSTSVKREVMRRNTIVTTYEDKLVSYKRISSPTP